MIAYDPKNPGPWQAKRCGRCSGGPAAADPAVSDQDISLSAGGADSALPRSFGAQADPVLLAELMDKLGETGADPAVSLGRVGILDPMSGQLTPAGRVFLTGAEDQRWTPLFEIRRNRVSLDDYDWCGRSEHPGPPAESIPAAVDAIVGQLGYDMAIVGVQRQEVPRLPVEAVREALANAVAHKTYLSNTDRVEVSVAPDAVAIKSPGPFGTGAFPEGEIARLSPRPETPAAPPNPGVAECLQALGQTRGDGGGIARICDAMARDMRPPPTVVATMRSVTVTLPTGAGVGNDPATDLRAWVLIKGREHGLDPRQHQMLFAAASGQWVTHRDTYNPDDDRKRLDRLTENGLLEHPAPDLWRIAAGERTPRGITPLLTSETAAGGEAVADRTSGRR